MARPVFVTTAFAPSRSGPPLNAALCVVTVVLTIHAESSTTRTLLRRWLLLGCIGRGSVLGFLTSDLSVPRGPQLRDDLTVTRRQPRLPSFHDYYLALLPMKRRTKTTHLSCLSVHGRR